jgi:hypothetical protein
MAVGEVWWEDDDEYEWGHLLAIGAVEVPDGTAVRLSVRVVAEVGVFVGDQESVTWQPGMPDSVLRNNRSIWGEHSYYISSGDGGVDLEFIRGLPRDSVFDLSVDGEVVPVGSFAAVAHLAPGLQELSVNLDDLGPDAPSVIAELTALQSLALLGAPADEDGHARLDDHALSVVADLPAVESLTLGDGTYTEHGLQQLGRLRTLRHLHVERGGLTASMFRFAATMPSLTRLSGVNEFLDDGPMPPAEIAQLRAMLPHVIVG